LTLTLNLNFELGFVYKTNIYLGLRKTKHVVIIACV
jgi:hypothetical protein